MEWAVVVKKGLNNEDMGWKGRNRPEGREGLDSKERKGVGWTEDGKGETTGHRKK